MSVTPKQLESLLAGIEGENLEFKEAKARYNFEELTRYCAALANEGGGKMILGVTDKRPRKVVGTLAFTQLERTRAGLMQKIPLRIDVSEVHHPDGRVLVFEVPSRPVGTTIQVDGVYWMRKGESLVPLSEDRLREIFAESGRDFSADICPDASFSDLSPEAVETFRRRWIEKSGNRAPASLSTEQVLGDIEAVVDGGLTYAALILFGTRGALGRHLAQSEVVFEYRSSDASGPAQQRKEYREGFFSFYDDLWDTINLRNDLQHYQDGLFVRDIPTFAEKSVREAVLNAVSHRDYQLGGNVFVRQYPRRIRIESPGGLPVGVDLGNILDRQSPRNRRVADIFARCGLVERSGQGMNLMFEESIQQGKPVPDFSGTDRYHVMVTLHGTVQDAAFVRYLEKVGAEKLENFSTQDFLILDLIHREQALPKALRARLPALAHLGVIEVAGKGRGTRYLLSRRYYAGIGKKGVYTRKRGLDRETNKELLLKHIRENAADGSRLMELTQILPALSRAQVQSLLRELKREGKIHYRGFTRAARWYPGRT
ncbi:MAG: ATP-binding protein [Elusimicrobiota bacterium]